MGAQAGLGGVWDVSGGSRVGLLAGPVKFNGSLSKAGKHFPPFSLSSWLQSQPEMGFLCLAQCEAEGADAHKTVLLLPEACVLMKEEDRGEKETC